MKLIKIFAMFLVIGTVSMNAAQAQKGKKTVVVQKSNKGVGVQGSNKAVEVQEPRTMQGQKKTVIVRQPVVKAKNPNYKNGYYRNHKVYRTSTGRKYYITSGRRYYFR